MSTSHENFITSLRPIMGQYSPASTTMGGTTKYSSLHVSVPWFSLGG